MTDSRSKDLSCAFDGAPHPSEAHKAACPVCNPTKTVPELNLAYVAQCEGGSGGPCCDPDCEKCWPDEPIDDATRYALGAM
jgi:hypothetical protein